MTIGFAVAVVSNCVNGKTMNEAQADVSRKDLVDCRHEYVLY